MSSQQDFNYSLRALSARVSVMEIALGAMAPMDPTARLKVLQDFDALADALLGQYLAEAVDESYIGLLEKSIEDIRAYLSGHISDKD